MFFDQFKRAYKAEIKSRIAERQVYLGQGKAVTFEDYQRHAGYIAGLEAALTALDDVIQKGGDEDE